jgi:hypothetical protein
MRLRRLCKESAEEEAAVAEADADRTLGVPTIPFDEIKRKYA